jgi:hypothetical protein
MPFLPNFRSFDSVCPSFEIRTSAMKLLLDTGTVESENVRHLRNGSDEMFGV